MYVLHAWKSSLQIFIPSNFKLFVMVTAKTFLTMLKPYIKYGWPFMLIVSFEVGLLTQLVDQEMLQALLQGAASYNVYAAAIVAFLVYALSLDFCNFLVALCARPSVDQKSCAYVRRYTRRYFLGYILLNIFFTVLSILLGIQRLGQGFEFKYHSNVTGSGFIEGPVQHFMVLLWFVTNIFAILFYLDLGGSFTSLFKSVWFACKMTFYNLPFVAIVAGVLLIGARLGDDYIPILSYLHVILYPILFCFITTNYTKKVHDQARLYQGA